MRWIAGAALAASLLASACADEAGVTDVAVPLSEGLTAQAEGREQDAEEAFAEVVEASPGNRVALYNLGILRRSRGDLDGALEAFDRIIAVEPDFVAARQQRAITRQSAGDLSGAIDDLRAAFAQAPENVEVRTHLGALLVATGTVEEGEALLGE